MPYIQTKVSTSITLEQETEMKKQMGEAISLLPGKSENWLMLEFSDNCRLYFQGNAAQPAAFIEVRLYGKADGADYERLTEALTAIVNKQLGIPENRIYVQYQETSYWGWNGHNF